MSTLESVKVKDYMSTKLITFTPEMEVMRAINTLVQHGIAGAPVVDKDGKVVGMFSERDCLSVALVASQDSCIAGPVGQFMSTKTVSVDPEMNLLQLATMFVNQSYRRYPVVENGKLIGQISRSDVMKAINAMC